MLTQNIKEEITNGLAGRSGDYFTTTLSTGQIAYCFRGKDAGTRAMEALENQIAAISGVENIDENTYCFVA